jgi:subtilisin family serine protease
MNLRVLNLSFGTDSTQDYKVDPIAHAVEKAWHSNIAVIVSAGNNGTSLGQLDNPARDPFVIAVGSAQTHGTAATGDDSVSTYSSRGNGVRNPDLVAPGQSVQSLRVKGRTSTPPTRPESWTAVLPGSGTSQAAAFVSGVAALMISRYGMRRTTSRRRSRPPRTPSPGSRQPRRGPAWSTWTRLSWRTPVRASAGLHPLDGYRLLDACGDADGRWEGLGRQGVGRQGLGEGCRSDLLSRYHELGRPSRINRGGRRMCGSLRMPAAVPMAWQEGRG